MYIYIYTIYIYIYTYVAYNQLRVEIYTFRFFLIINYLFVDIK